MYNFPKHINFILSFLEQTCFDLQLSLIIQMYVCNLAHNCITVFRGVFSVPTLLTVELWANKYINPSSENYSVSQLKISIAVSQLKIIQFALK